MWRIGTLLVAVCFTASSGCLCRGICTKRDNELCCPTDVRKTHFWCFGEDAFIQGPCGPKEELYGYEPTCWREFPAVPPCYGFDYCERPRPLPPVNEELPSLPVAQPPASASSPIGNPFADHTQPADAPGQPQPNLSPPGAAAPLVIPPQSNPPFDPTPRPVAAPPASEATPINPADFYGPDSETLPATNPHSQVQPQSIPIVASSRHLNVDERSASMPTNALPQLPSTPEHIVSRPINYGVLEPESFTNSMARSNRHHKRPLEALSFNQRPLIEDAISADELNRRRNAAAARR